MATWYIWHFWSDEYEELDVVKTTPTRVQLQGGNWTTKRTAYHIIAPLIETIETLRYDIARARVLQCQQDLNEAQHAMDHAMHVPLKRKKDAV